MKMVVSYLNFVFFIKVKAKSKYKILNFFFQFIKKTKWHFGYTDLTSLHGLLQGSMGHNREGIRVPKVLFHFFDKLKYEIRNKDLIFVSILKLRQKTPN